MDYLAGVPSLSGREAECCEGLITAVEVQDASSDCDGDKYPELDGLHYQFYNRMPDLFEYLLARVFTNWQQWVSTQICEPGCGYNT